MSQKWNLQDHNTITNKLFRNVEVFKFLRVTLTNKNEIDKLRV